ncbi:putative xyloglucan glycosyltransferase [Trifolium repens]|nr:putative xyloglucan glycosyltransferase [Trifolium repens]
MAKEESLFMAPFIILEALLCEKSQELKKKDEIIAEKEKKLHDKLSSIQSLQNEVDSLQDLNFVKDMKSNTWEKVNLIGDKFEYDRERRMREKGDSFGMEIFLKAHRDVGCVAWLVIVLWDLFGSIKKRMRLLKMQNQ